MTFADLDRYGGSQTKPNPNFEHNIPILNKEMNS
jgi:hypothetical protein